MWPTARGLAILAAALAMAVPAGAVEIEREAREIEALLMAPCCFSQQVSVHHSEAAEEVRRDIRRRLAYETRDQILQAYVARYGKRILAEPPATGFDRLLYGLPPVALALTAVFLVVMVRRFAGRPASNPPAVPPDGAPGIDDRYAAELDEALRDLDA